MDPPWGRVPLRVDTDLREVFEKAVSSLSQAMTEGKASNSDLVRRLEDWAVSMSQLADEHYTIISSIPTHVMYLRNIAGYCCMFG